MELKVWMDGVQRIISGVTAETSCKDIVLCLAQATQQFGKFILVERWSNNERLLSPNDNPIKVLKSWGEHASDVTFVMKRFDQTIDEGNGKSSSFFNESTKKSMSSANPYNKEEYDHLLYSQSKDLFNAYRGNSIVRRPRKPPPYYEAIAKSTLLSASGQTQTSHDGANSHEGTNDCNRNVRTPKFDNERGPVKMAKSQEDRSRIRSEAGQTDAIKLIKMQKDTMATQERESSQLNAEITFWDNKYHREEELKRELKAEIRHLEKILKDRDEQIREFEECNIEKEMESLERESERLEIDKNFLKSQMHEIDNKISKCQSTINELTDQINRLQRDDESFAKKEEERIMKQVEEIKLEVKEKSREYERQSEQIKLIDEEIRQTDDIIKERIEKIEKILKELKEANLQGLSLLPIEDIFTRSRVPFKLHSSTNLENEKKFFQSKPHRLGSTRRTYSSPRELKNAVATSKNPDGVWV